MLDLVNAARREPEEPSDRRLGHPADARGLLDEDKPADGAPPQMVPGDGRDVVDARGAVARPGACLAAGLHSAPPFTIAPMYRNAR